MPGGPACVTTINLIKQGNTADVMSLTFTPAALTTDSSGATADVLAGEAVMQISDDTYTYGSPDLSPVTAFEGSTYTFSTAPANRNWVAITVNFSLPSGVDNDWNAAELTVPFMATATAGS